MAISRSLGRGARVERACLAARRADPCAVDRTKRQVQQHHRGPRERTRTRTSSRGTWEAWQTPRRSVRWPWACCRTPARVVLRVASCLRHPVLPRCRGNLIKPRRREHAWAHRQALSLAPL